MAKARTSGTVSFNRDKGKVNINTSSKNVNSAFNEINKIISPIVNNVTSNNSFGSVSNSPESFIRQMSNDNSAQTFAFNRDEAQKARDFSEYMSNTSHQREVEDLKRAGLNPVLSANGGASAYSASSASGSADSSAVGAIASIYLNKMNNDNAVKIAEMQTKNQLDIAKLGNKNAKEIAKINAAASKYASDNASSASRYASDNSYSASRYASDTSYAGTQYGADRSKYGMIDSFINALLGNGESSNSASKNSGNYLRKGLKHIVKKFKK